MFKEYKKVTPSSLRRIYRLVKKGYDVCLDFFADIKGSKVNLPWKVQISSSSGEIYVSRCLLDQYDYDSDTYREESLEGVTLDDIVVDSMEDIYYNSSKW